MNSEEDFPETRRKLSLAKTNVGECVLNNKNFVVWKQKLLRINEITTQYKKDTQVIARLTIIFSSERTAG